MKEKTQTTSMQELAPAVELIAELRKTGKPIRFLVYESMLTGLSIDELELSQRSYNCLKRAGFEPVSELVKTIERCEDLLQYRNLGRKSAQEIMFKIYLLQYRLLSPEGRGRFLQSVRELNI